MSIVATPEAPATRRDGEEVEPAAPRLFEPQGPTLEDRIVATWEALASAGHATCPVCAGEMSRGGACERCGSELR